MFRSLRAPPTLSADWKGDYDEKAAEWFELFLDLMMVAVCINVAHKLEAHLDWTGLATLVFVFWLYVTTWQAYTFYNSRFNETSLLHYAFLFVLVCGFGGMVLSSDPSTGFTFGLILTRVSMLGMYINASLLVPSIRLHLRRDILSQTLSLTVLVVSLCLPSAGRVPCYIALLALDIVVRPVLIFNGIWHPPGPHIPLNIDHSNERHGCFVLVTLGETVLSSILKLDSEEVNAQFYIAMALALLIVFTLAIFYFGSQPPRELHALRRSRATGMAFGQVHLVLLPSLLALGAAVASVMKEAVVRQPLHAAQVWLLFGSISASMVGIVVLRLLHFGGRSILPCDPAPVGRIKRVWWAVAFSGPFLPLLGAAVIQWAYAGHADAIGALAVAFGSLSVMLFSEMAIIHWLSTHGQFRIACLLETSLIDESSGGSHDVGSDELHADAGDHVDADQPHSPEAVFKTA